VTERHLARRGSTTTRRPSGAGRCGTTGLLPLLGALALLSACAQLPERPELPPQSAAAPGDAGPLDTAVAAAEASHPGESAFRLVSEGPEAFVIRAHTARLAARSIDVQTYIWHADLTGRFLAKELLDAGDRGVRVRLLVDDLDARNNNYAFAALDAHPNIDVRMFNPLASREGTLSMAFEFVGGMKRLNRRMHNKSWIVDNRIALAGGRNLGDEYFGASDEVNFADLDFAMVGPVVRDVSASFDRFWNSGHAWPVALLSPEAVTQEALAAIRPRLQAAAEATHDSRYATVLAGDPAVQRLLAGDWPMTWTSRYEFVSDSPDKIDGEVEGIDSSGVARALGPVFGETRELLTIVSPYFVPGEGGTGRLVSMREAGRSVRILTNSLAANDVAAVHGGYSRYRKKLLKGGVELWELKPQRAGAVESSLFGSSGASLHTKAVTTDGEVLFVGSFNLDPRSVSLNTEQGVIVHDRGLAAQLETLFSRMASGSKSWRVTLHEGRLQWSDEFGDYDAEPEASGWRRFQAWLTRVLPVESQL
jgi:putative cardiolipin synthase